MVAMLHATHTAAVKVPSFDFLTDDDDVMLVDFLHA